MALKIGVVGDKDSVLPFKILGFDVFATDNGNVARETIDSLAEQNYGVIYLTEAIAKEIPDTIKRYDAEIKPAIILIPNHKGSLNIGKNRIQQNVEKAVGQNIL
ncbi:MAG: V-type ATP synthase subunit F [Amphibacillus sp.]|uniref:V-type ATP synthase G subunit n=1 Tax=Amphibacillus xylanus (strain ATCC 51415 / DSM 6626 / JCM 7361 / LMG 17667 / NBRC 15112 / Ep01) TaxID=698758 RepID=K0J7I8_AMPXN|nr:V-type ATP synthase subunit F [Amphibacillus xylanus]NMA91174.1 V-type ATP synthase subunit F [Amphibacillus sp.]BAM47458.1 V-type ATP synthase G subunit [Amphibacillus xylanus NBRC 15112]